MKSTPILLLLLVLQLVDMAMQGHAAREVRLTDAQLQEIARSLNRDLVHSLPIDRGSEERFRVLQEYLDSSFQAVHDSVAASVKEGAEDVAVASTLNTVKAPISPQERDLALSKINNLFNYELNKTTWTAEQNEQLRLAAESLSSADKARILETYVEIALQNGISMEEFPPPF